MNDKTNGQQNDQIQAQDLPVTILAQYIRDLSFENPNATEAIQGGGDLPQMDISIGMDARKIPDEQRDGLYEVVLNARAEAVRGDSTLFIAELQYGVTVLIGDEIPQANHHPLLLIEIPRMAFPFARQIMADLTVQGGYPPLLLNPVDFHALYMQRFGKEIEAARQDLQSELKADVQKTAEKAAKEKPKKKAKAKKK